MSQISSQWLVPHNRKIMLIIFLLLTITIFFPFETFASNDNSEEQKNDIEENIRGVLIPEGYFWFGTQIVMGDGNLVSPNSKDGAEPRKYKKVPSFRMDSTVVTNEMFKKFVDETEYKTEAENYGWSFVLEQLASTKTIKIVDSKEGMGRVPNSKHWMGVVGADWRHPEGPDSNIDDKMQYPVVQVSHTDAESYCEWADMSLPHEIEWEYAARGGFVNKTYPWGDVYYNNHINIWEGKFPKHDNEAKDGYIGIAPAESYKPNDYGLYNMLGNVWEWCRGGTSEERILRGGSFIDSLYGEFNHAVMVSTRQINTGDSAADNTGFRCVKVNKKKKNSKKKLEKKNNNKRNNKNESPDL